jgi:hypothetical protein
MVSEVSDHPGVENVAELSDSKNGSQEAERECLF